jgi:hypothetical protein
MAEVKTAVGMLEKKEEGDGSITVHINVNSKYPLKIKAWTRVSKTDPTPTNICAELEGVKPGQKVSVTYYEKPGEFQGKPVTYRNLVSIAIATDATPISAPPSAPPAPAHKPAPKEGREFESIEERRKGIGWSSAYNNACHICGPMMLKDYEKGAEVNADWWDLWIKNIEQVAGALYDSQYNVMNGAK